MLMKEIMCMSVVTMHHAVLMSFYVIIKVMVILLFTLMFIIKPQESFTLIC